MTTKDLIPNLFRAEFGRLTAMLCARFGMASIDLAEDIASETFLTAMDTWPYKGIPDNPAAWLHTVARHKAINRNRRDQHFRDVIRPELATTDPTIPEPEWHFPENSLGDSQLRMFFAVCHPSIPEASQVSLALRVLCGFGIDEIADALLEQPETIAKRIQRAKAKIRSEKIELVFPRDDELQTRLETVLRIIYLIFSEGYYSQRREPIIRKDLCLEALQLAYLLLGHPDTNTHEANALISLMCFQSSRIEARLSGNGDLVLYEEQDKNLWDSGLVEKGFHYLQQASRWQATSPYYLEACIAYWHTVKEDRGEKWEAILQLYDLLLATNYSPVAAMNRIYAFCRVHGNPAALRELEKFRLPENIFYFLLLSELHRNLDQTQSLAALENALGKAQTETEERLIRKKITELRKG